MNNLYFNTNVNSDIVPDISQIQQSIDRAMKNMSEKLNKILVPVVNTYVKQLSINLSAIIESSLVKPLNELKLQVNISPEIIKNMQKALDSCVNNLNISQNEKEVVVDFSDEQIKTMKTVNVPVDDYTKPEKSDKNHKTMSIKTLASLIVLLVTIISFFSDALSLATSVIENKTAMINNDTAHTEYQTALLNNDTAKTQNNLQDVEINTLLETANELIDKYNEATADEIISN